MKKDVIKVLYPLIFNQYVSKAIICPNIVFDKSHYEISKLSNFIFFCGKDKIYKYRVIDNTIVYDLFIVKSAFVSGYDLNIDRSYGNYFLYIEMKSNKHTLPSINVRSLKFYVNSEFYNEILFNIFSGNRKVYCVHNNVIKELGVIRLIDLNSSYINYDMHILYMISYFTDQKYFNAFVIEINNEFVYDDIDELKIIVSVTSLLSHKNMLIFNYLYVVNIFEEKSGYKNLVDGLTYDLYTDYYSRDFVKVFSVQKVIATQKGTGNDFYVPNYYSANVLDGSFLRGLYLDS